jgi:hypothetical protein
MPTANENEIFTSNIQILRDLVSTAILCEIAKTTNVHVCFYGKKCSVIDAIRTTHETESKVGTSIAMKKAWSKRVQLIV